jgi:hypothetical protein
MSLTIRHKYWIALLVVAVLPICVGTGTRRRRFQFSWGE